MPIKVPPIQELSRDERPWRIDWLGSSQRNENVPTDPSIEVVISPLKGGEINSSTKGVVTSADQQRVHIGVGQLPFLRIGSVWCQGRVQRRAIGEVFWLPDVQIEPNTVSLITTGHEIAPGRYAIPPYLYKVGAALGAKCLAIHYNNDPYGIILPVAEAIRFYYAGSTDLSQIAFYGSYEHARESIINTELSGHLDDRRLCVLRLRRWLADDDAWTIGRVLSSDIAYAGVKRIHDSLLISTSNHVLAYPECHLPFHGTTTWRARGLKISLGANKHRFLVFELLRCSAPFPFDDLEVTRDNDGRQSENPDEDVPESEKKPAWGGNKRPPSNDGGEEKPLQSEREPDGRVLAVEIPLTGERFDALDGKCVIRHPKEECRYKGVKFEQLIPMATTALGTGEGKHSPTDVEKAKIVMKSPRSKGLAASLETLIEVIRILNVSPGVQASIFCPDVKWRLPLIQPSNRAQWAYLDSSTKARRGVLAAEVRYKKCFNYVVEFEQRLSSDRKTAGLIANQDGSAMSRQIFTLVLLALSRNKGVWDEVSLRKIGVVCVRLKHTWKDAQSCAQAVVERLHGHTSQ